MPRKKKEEPEIHLYPEIDLSPYDTIETTTLGDSQGRFITATHSEAFLTCTSSTGNVRICYPSVEYWEPSSTILGHDALTRKSLKREEETTMEINAERLGRTCRVYCSNTVDLSQGRVSLTLSAIKGRLMMETAGYPVEKFYCGMTPMVKTNLIQAGRRAKMYGRKMPIIASFDEFWNQLPDEIEILGSQGVSIDILNPEMYRRIILRVDR